MHLKRFLPHAIAIALFISITIIQFKPLFNGKVINQSDITQHIGMSKEISDFRKAEHKEPLWTNTMFCGMPAYQVSVLYPGNWLTFLDKVFHLYLPHPSGSIFMCFLGFFILLLCLQIDPWLALIGSLAFGLSSYFYIILEVGHNSKANAIAYLPAAIGGVILLLRQKYWLGFAITTLFMALELNANHVQIAYYGLLLLSLIFVAYFIVAVKKKNVRGFSIAVAIFIGSFFISVLPNAGNLLCTYEYGKHTTRGKTELTIGPDGKSNADSKTSGLDKNYAVQYSYGVMETFTFLIPDFKGGASNEAISSHKSVLKKLDPQLRDMAGQFSSYYGPQEYTAGPVYIGAIVMFLAFLCLLIVDHPIKWALFVSAAFSVMLAWGKYFMGLSAFFLDYMPGYNKFRAVSIIDVVAELCIPLMAVLALQKIVAAPEGFTVRIPFVKKQPDLKKLLIVSFIVMGGFCLLCIVMPDAFNSFSKPGEESQIEMQFKRAGYPEEQVKQVVPDLMTNISIAREAIFKNDAWRSFIFILITALFLYLFMIRRIKVPVLYAALGILILVDLWPVAQRYLNKDSFVAKTQFAEQPLTAADEEIRKDTGLNYRVANIAASPFQDATTSYYHNSIGGYHGAKLKKYDELIQFHLFRDLARFQNGLFTAYASDSLRNLLFAQLQVLNMLNTKYFICPTKEEPVVVQNTQANGNAWFVKKVQTVDNADEEILALNTLDTKNSCVIQQKNKTGLSVADTYNGEGKIKLQSIKANESVYTTETTEKQFAVFSEIYYKDGWNAYLDGNPVPHTCVDYVLRGMEIPPGKHQIVFRFEPEVYKTSNMVAVAGSAILLLSVASGLYFSFRKRELVT
jgi:hypothetical protein